ncbi:MAG TPA: hypothetical protein VI653_30535, partial [Steroidobacteraceae bacterium]
MFTLITVNRGVWLLVLTGALIAPGVSNSFAQTRVAQTRQATARAFSVDGRVGLASLISLSDGH